MLMFFYFVLLPIVKCTHDLCLSCLNSKQKNIEEFPEVEEGKYPFVAYILEKVPFRVHCMGAVIRHDAILTLARCFEKGNGNFLPEEDLHGYTLALETTKPLSPWIPKLKLKSVDFYPLNEDVAMVSFEAKRKIRTVQPVLDVKFTEYELMVNRTLCVLTSLKLNGVNYGVTKSKGRSEDTLREVDIWLLRRSECGKWAKVSKFCANIAAEEKSLCRAVRGAPLFCEGTLLGLYEFNTACLPTTNDPSVFIHIGKYAFYFSSIKAKRELRQTKTIFLNNAQITRISYYYLFILIKLFVIN